MDYEVVLRGVLPPILLALLLVSIAGTRLLPIAMAVGLYLAHGLLKEWLAWPHELWREPNGVGWLVWGIIAAALVSTARQFRYLPESIASALSLVIASATVWLMLGKVAANWSSIDFAWNVGGSGFLAATTVLVILDVIERRPDTAQSDIGLGVLFAVMLSLDAALMVLGKSAFLGQLCGAVAAALGAAVGACLWRRSFTLHKADGIWIGCAHALFILAGVHLSYLDWWPAGIALATPFLLLLLPRLVSGKKSWRWLCVAGLLLVSPLVFAMWLAQPEANPYGY